MLNIAVCDDEEKILNLICNEIKKEFQAQGETVQITSYQSGIALREDILNGRVYQVLFLDISMPDMNGLFLSRHLKLASPNTLLLFLSSQEDAVFEAIKSSPFRFVRKRTFQKELPSLVHDILDHFQSRAVMKICLSGKKGELSIDPYELIYAEAYNKTVVLISTHEQVEIKTTFSSLEQKLLPFGFLKVHRSILVNYRFIRSIQGNELTLDDGRTLPVSKHRLSQVKTEFHRLLSAESPHLQ